MGDMSESGAARPNRAESGPARPAPLVEPLAALRPEAAIRAQRQITLPGFGEEAQRRLANASVLVIGAGGLGCASVPYLAGAGVGRIGVLDDDLVETSNLHRQVTHRAGDVGRAKVDALAEMVFRLDPSITVDRHRLRLTSDNALELFAQYDLVLDGSDNFPTRYLANDAAELAGRPLVWGAILQYSGQVGVAWHAHGAGYRDIFPTPPPADSVLSCAEGGVLPGLCGTVGSLMATEALKLIAGIGDPLIGRVLVYDALAARTRELRVNRNPQAAPVNALVDYELFCGVAAAPHAATGDATRGDITAHDDTPDIAAVITAVSAEDFASALRADPQLRVIDVRSAPEHDERRVRASQHTPVEHIEADGLPRASNDDTLWLYCERDPRSRRAAEALAARGATDVRYLQGGISQLARVAPELIERGAIAHSAHDAFAQDVAAQDVAAQDDSGTYSHTAEPREHA